MMKSTNVSISANIVENIIKSNHIFNNITVALRPQIIKVSLKSDMAIIQLDIWNIQSSKNAKELINRCFNIGRHIIIIKATNMNPRVLQCKNCQKQGHAIFLCRASRSKYIKYNRPHKTKYHQQFSWCYKTNFETNPLRLKTKQDKSCLHIFKYINCKGKHQADSNICPFWRYCFNRE